MGDESFPPLLACLRCGGSVDEACNDPTHHTHSSIHIRRVVFNHHHASTTASTTERLRPGHPLD